MSKTIKACVITLGCRVNQYESDAIMLELSKNGVIISGKDEVCDIYIINTCTVTAESDRKSRQFIRRCVAKNPNAVIIVTGCYSQINPEEALAIDGVDFVCGNNGKSIIAKKALELLESKAPKSMFMPDIYNAKFDQMNVGAPLTRTRAFIKIQDGCESKCAYCIIPSARGNVRSDSKENIINEVKRAVSEGCVEVVLTGIETASYGRDFKNGYSLADLLYDVNEIEGVERIRLGSIDPASITKEFVDKIATLSKVMPHFHISMQSGCSKTLASMRRKYNIDMANERINYLRKSIPSLMLSADVITGFPGESDEDFNETLSFFKNQHFLHLHIFPYSKRKGTVAYSMPNQVDESIKKERLRQLSNMELEIHRELLSEYIKSHEIVPVLFESYDGEFAYGHSPSFVEIKIKSNENLSGKIINVKLLDSDDERVIGKLLNF
ncbi:MAG: tRNA (N(6)-L-threonylcarbamoyladenosine(37)-C(2))-methylthiotransferase MtaB [Clostridia bacterium]|nr:tRNA (N(6)-L-threonylcarbamoyladenosine(37)-C(2))-methylthiotransferase MtaB [Clostridia bacterium]